MIKVLGTGGDGIMLQYLANLCNLGATHISLLLETLS